MPARGLSQPTSSICPCSPNLSFNSSFTRHVSQQLPPDATNWLKLRLLSSVGDSSVFFTGRRFGARVPLKLQHQRQVSTSDLPFVALSHHSFFLGARGATGFITIATFEHSDLSLLPAADHVTPPSLSDFSYTY